MEKSKYKLLAAMLGSRPSRNDDNELTLFYLPTISEIMFKFAVKMKPVNIRHKVVCGLIK